MPDTRRGARVTGKSNSPWSVLVFSLGRSNSISPIVATDSPKRVQQGVADRFGIETLARGAQAYCAHASQLQPRFVFCCICMTPPISTIPLADASTSPLGARGLLPLPQGTSAHCAPFAASCITPGAVSRKPSPYPQTGGFCRPIDHCGSLKNVARRVPRHPGTPFLGGHARFGARPQRNPAPRSATRTRSTVMVLVAYHSLAACRGCHEAGRYLRRPPSCPEGPAPWLCHPCAQQRRPPQYALQVDGPLHPGNYRHLCQCGWRRAAGHCGPHVVLS